MVEANTRSSNKTEERLWMNGKRIERDDGLWECEEEEEWGKEVGIYLFSGYEKDKRADSQDRKFLLSNIRRWTKKSKNNKNNNNNIKNVRRSDSLNVLSIPNCALLQSR